jgi:hypothetical protein
MYLALQWVVVHMMVLPDAAAPVIQHVRAVLYLILRQPWAVPRHAVNPATMAGAGEPVR